MKQHLDKLKDLLHPDKVVVKWVFHGSDHCNHYLINRTFLLVAGIFSGVPKAFRVPGAVEYRDTSDGDRIRYAGDTVRVTSGQRKGVLMPIHRIREDECVQRVGLGKWLCLGKEAHKMSPRRTGDQVFISDLLSMCTDAIEADSMPTPSVRVAVRPARRGSVRSRAPIQADTYQPDCESVPGKCLYDYSLFYGHGVCVALSDDEVVAPVILNRENLNSSTAAIQFELLDYMNEF